MSEERCMLDSQLDLLQQHLIVEKGLSRNTLAAYMSDLQQFGMFVRARGASMFQDLSREDIREVVPLAGGLDLDCWSRGTRLLPLQETIESFERH